MRNRKNFRTYSVNLVAGQDYNLDVEGDMYAVIESDGEFSITLDESNRLRKQVSGMGGSFPSIYERVTLHSVTTQIVTVVLGFGHFNDARSSVNATLTTVVEPSNLVDNSADVLVTNTATLIKAADTTTNEVIIHVPSDAPNSIRVGNSSVTALTGVEIEAGGTLILTCEAALYAIRDGASNVAVSTLKLSRP